MQDKKHMSQKQYLKTIEKEIQRINRIIDMKILRGEEYMKEARDHKLLLKKFVFIIDKISLGVCFLLLTFGFFILNYTCPVGNSTNGDKSKNIIY